MDEEVPSSRLKSTDPMASYSSAVGLYVVPFSLSNIVAVSSRSLDECSRLYWLVPSCGLMRVPLARPTADCPNAKASTVASTPRVLAPAELGADPFAGAAATTS